MSKLEIAFLGPPTIELDGRPVETERRKAVALLAYLVVTGKTHRRDQLAALLWPDYEHASAFSYLRRTIWELNNILGPGWIEADRETVIFNTSPDFQLDIADFERFLSASRTGGLVTLEQAVSLYRGDFLGGFVVQDTAPFEDWQMQQAEYFRREFSGALERLIAACEKEQAFEKALPHARRWLALDPLNEAAHRAIMRLHAGLGDRSAVVHQYEACVKVLKDELRVVPQTETTGLYEKIIRGGAPGGIQSQFQPISRLPSFPTPFIGRQPEIEQVKELILNPDHRLLTLIGPGGTGKTRLSIQLASEVVEAFPEGVWFVPLAPLPSAEAMVPTIAKALDFSFYREQEQPRHQLLDYLRDKQLLLILDNFEHLVEQGRELVGQVLSTSKRLKVLVTSRERLNLQAEQLYRVSGMRIPDAAETAAWDDPEEQAKPFSAMQLFVERARRVWPGFRLTHDHLPAVMEICNLVNGMPLGIELAAAWLEVLTPKEIAAEIVRSLDFLQTDLQDVSDRQRSLRAVFESSWKLLNEEEQKVIQELAVFPGSFSREAVQRVSGASLRMLLELANKSWLQPVDQDRFQVHEVLKQYGQQHLRADAAHWQVAKDRHAEYFMEFVEAQEMALRGAGQIEALAWMELEFGNNLQAVWEWLIERKRYAELIGRILPGLFHFGLVRGHTESVIALVERARQALAEAGTREEILQWVILGTVEAFFESNWSMLTDQSRQRLHLIWKKVGEYNLIEEIDFWYLALASAYQSEIGFEEGAPGMREFLLRIRAKDDPWMMAYALLSAYWLAQADAEEKQRYLAEALELFQNLGAVHERGTALRILGDIAWQKGSFEDVVRYKRSAIELFEKAGDQPGAGWVWFELAEIYLHRGAFDEAFHAYQEQRRIFERNGNLRLVGTNLSWESIAVSRYGTWEHALETRQRCLEIFQDGKRPHDLAWANWEMGELYRLRGDPTQARIWYDHALPQFEKLQDRNGLSFYQRGLGDIALGLGQWEDAYRCFQEALDLLAQEHRSMKNWTFAYVQAGLGRALVGMGKYPEARDALQEAVHWAQERGSWDLVLAAMVGFAALSAATGKSEKAVEQAAFVTGHPLSWNETKSRAMAELARASQGLSEGVVQAAQARARSMTLEDAVCLALDPSREET